MLPDPLSTFVQSGGVGLEAVRLTLDAVPSCLLIFDERQRLLFANATASAFLTGHHLMPAQLPANPFEATQIYDSAGRERVMPDDMPWCRALRGQTIDSADFLIRPVDKPVDEKNEFWIECSARAIPDAAGQICGAILMWRDITRFKTHELATDAAGTLNEEAVRQGQQRFTAFMRYLPGIAFIKDLSGKYVYYNEACISQFNMRPEEILGKTDQEIWSAEDAARYTKNDAVVISDQRPIEFIEPVRHGDAEHSWLIYKFPIVENEKVTMVGGIGIDITERRLLEEQLVEARKMEALGRLAGGVAHDFNNLLTVISGYGQLALEGMGGTPAPRLTVYLQEILDSARRASGLTGQLLAFSRRQTVRPKVIDLSALLRNIEHLLQRMIGELIDLKVRYGHEPCLIRADAHQMEQVLMNLVANARDAMPLGGTIEIDCDVLPEPLERPGLPPLGVLVQVSDTGIGMDDSIKAHVFEPFFTSKDKGKGTGLGLSTVYGVISQAGGEIDLQSALGEGTRFRIYLPLASVEGDETLAGPDTAAPQGVETVLLVEDEASVRDLVESVLKRLGYRVLVADGGEAALKIWKEKQGLIDVLLTDVIMPHMSGGELANQLRGLSPRLKILFMSGYTDDMIAGQGVLAGETQLIQKPFTAESLGRKLRDVLDA